MPIFESKARTVAFIASILAFAPYYLFLGKEKLKIMEPRHVRMFFGIWLAAFTFEYYFLGPYSFIEQTTEGNLNVTVNYYLTHGYDGGTFTHQYAGGQDIYTLLFGKHFFNPERTLIGLFPLWVAILLHKIYVAALGFIGAYLLVRHVNPGNRAGATALAAIFPVSHLYLLNFSTNWAPGFSALPLVVYLSVARSAHVRYWPGILLAAIVITPADPIHVFPALAVAVLGGVFLIPGVNIKRVALSFGLLVLASFANWHEVLYAFYQNVQLTTRMEGQGGYELSFLEAAWFALGYAVSSLKIPGVLLLLSFLVLAAARDAYLKRALWATFLWLFSFALAEGLPWERLGLEAIGQLSHYYMLLSLMVIFLPVTARALAALKPDAGTTVRWPRKIMPEVVLLASALSIMTWDKAVNFANFTWFGGQANLFAYETLRDTSWRPEEDFRVVTLLETPNANIVAGMYGLDTFDGQLNMNHTAWQDYWFSIVRRDPAHMLTSRVGVKWKLWDGQFYDVDKHIRLDLLGIANVRFLLSGLPLKGAGLNLVFAPSSGAQAKMARPKSSEARLEFLKFRLKKVFNPGQHYVYELPRFLPRVFIAADVLVRPDDVTGIALHDKIAMVAPRRTVVVARKNASSLQGLGKLRSVTHRKVPDGFDLTVDAPDGGIAVVNVMYVPFWKAEDENGRALDIVPANAVQMALAVKPGVKTIRLRYRRPRLVEKLAEGIGGATHD